MLCLDSISRLQNEGDRYTRKIEQEKRRIQELETQIGNLTASIERSRRKRGDARGNKGSSVVTNTPIASFAVTP
jgi:predicted  nucleic acid-binding Zn-ribbon protein